MPRWVQHTLWFLLLLILLANHRKVGAGLAAFGSGLKDLFSADLFRYEDPLARFLLTGILIVAVVGILKIYWTGRSNRGQ